MRTRVRVRIIGLTYDSYRSAFGATRLRPGFVTSRSSDISMPCCPNVHHFARARR